MRSTHPDRPTLKLLGFNVFLPPNPPIKGGFWVKIDVWGPKSKQYLICIWKYFLGSLRKAPGQDLIQNGQFWLKVSSLGAVEAPGQDLVQNGQFWLKVSSLGAVEAPGQDLVQNGQFWLKVSSLGDVVRQPLIFSISN